VDENSFAEMMPQANAAFCSVAGPGEDRIEKNTGENG